MQIGIPREILNQESRVAATPATVIQLKKLGFSVVVQRGAGEAANFKDEAYLEAGAEIVSLEEAFQADLILKVNAPTIDADTGVDETDLMKAGATVISFVWPAQNPELLEKFKAKGINLLAMDMVPRISRAQSLDARSSLANVDGYRAVIEAANHFGRFFTGQITAAGKVPPAKVLIIGAGVAGLSALGTAGSLGAIVRAFDTRPEVKEQINSMGAEFLEVDFEEVSGSGDGYAKVMSKEFIEAEMALFREQAKDVDIIITTALIPGKPAPKLILEDMVGLMKPGSVIVDLAAANGGNCELTVPGEVAVVNDVTIIGYTELSRRLPTQASQLYGTNLVNLLKLMAPEKDGNYVINFDDEVIRGVAAVKDGEITFPPPVIQVSAQPQAKVAEAVADVVEKKKNPWIKRALLLVAAGLFGLIANSAPADFLQHFSVFVLSCVVGYYVVWNVSHSLHTPLMSVTNAISGIIVVGALVQMNSDSTAVLILSGIAILIASINIAGGFTVTQRMLKMFRKD
ncbi:Re/Si-specific NAD(P)(+) transhydrogenase subunit alpha [Shewanella sp. D64]|uniref:Re/Si-specific NAD(P)(+) transhydrogenase subunit alpha n=1 Tax=unclassified Shewanella TaxID=196818 RepID=UPI0022BA29D8|nr:MULTISPECIES: Re/Si-specific NAD(P)(+) transhydrogenase subunit alpha [unclassified Shewanella]MEC4728778.1 Re/Si-specific NAD(P)(+) transhydrogenase subunit alpha [Shewanella sp. D64]MEC4740652.1 Re/Si-specific NAD(P)(+) transhydrogenase subunit alpha [Shewanella sp. E94]WBJ93365.1 Re/Si-specific NAD(P)(+) transhydrogenase subunit alpha [Shewanella sp. MTB7]